MYRILFVCHGNICRSPMAEFLFNHTLSTRGLSGAFAESAATSSEEIGNPVHRGTARVLDRFKIDYSKKRARRLTPADYCEYDLIVCMERRNITNALRAMGLSCDSENKLCLLLDYAPQAGRSDIADPWYTGDFESTLADIQQGLSGLVSALCGQGILCAR